MDNYRLKIKIGDHEFEAEGPIDVVQSQFDAFKDMISSITSSSVTKKSTSNTYNENENNINVSETTITLDKITRIEERVVSLTARPDTIGDALLTILLGQRTLRGNDSVTGSELISGLRQSGVMVGLVDSEAG